MTATVPRPPSARPALSALRDRAMRLAELVTTPLLPADYLDMVNPLRAGADLRGRVVAVHRETRDAATLVIRPGADWQRHVPGQDRKSTRLNSSHANISYAVFCLKKKK